MTEKHFDEVIHAPNRLKICAFLFPLESADFQVIREELDVSESVLSKHIKQLENSGYVEQKKGSTNGKKRTWVYLTSNGRKAFKAHVDALKSMFSDSENTN